MHATVCVRLHDFIEGIEAVRLRVGNVAGEFEMHGVCGDAGAKKVKCKQDAEGDIAGEAGPEGGSGAARVRLCGYKFSLQFPRGLQ